MPGIHPQQDSRSAKIEESAAFECQECSTLRSNQPHHSHGLRSTTFGARLQPARPVLAAPRDEPALSGPRVHVPPGHFGIFTRSREEESRDGGERAEERT